MGHRGNYIIKENNQTKIYYTHWRAKDIACDLLTGKKAFITFVRELDEYEQLLVYPWIEGFVYLDLDQQELVFYEEEWLDQSSVLRAYLRKLRRIWKDWDVKFAKQGECFLTNVDRDYLSYHDEEFEIFQADILEDVDEKLHEEYWYGLVCLHLTQLEQPKIHYFEGLWKHLLLFNQSFLEELKNRKSDVLQSEAKLIGEFTFIVIDETQKRITVNVSVPTYREQLADFWEGWTIDINTRGYIDILEEEGVDTKDIVLSEKEIGAILKKIETYSDDFSPLNLAKNLVEELGEDVQVHPSFFENKKPKAKSTGFLQQLIYKLKSIGK